MKITMLGCGPSMGVPAIGPDWGACDPTDPRNRRRRTSILIECRGQAILVDASPDLRAQLLDAQVNRLDALILTHAHADHLHGIDDLRGFNRLMQPIAFTPTRSWPTSSSALLMCSTWCRLVVLLSRH